MKCNYKNKHLCVHALTPFMLFLLFRNKPVTHSMQRVVQK